MSIVNLLKGHDILSEIYCNIFFNIFLFFGIYKMYITVKS